MLDNRDKNIGTVVTVPEPPTQSKFYFVADPEWGQHVIKVGLYVIIEDENHTIMATIETVQKSNRYFSNAESVFNYEKTGMGINSLFPIDQWEFLICECNVLGSLDREGLHRASRPISPGAKVKMAPNYLLSAFLGLNQKTGLYLGDIPHHGLEAKFDISRLLQKHLAILSISGGGKSYTTKVLIEELLRRSPQQGRPAVVIFDVHGEYTELKLLKQHPKFKKTEIIVYKADKIGLHTPEISAADFADYVPDMSGPQIRELSKIIHRRKNRPKRTEYDLSILINEIEYDEDMNSYVREALIGWLLQLHRTGLFGVEERPNIKNILKPGVAIIFDLSPILSLKTKQIIVSYFLKKIFRLRRENKIPPTVLILEEAHQFCPEGTGIRSPAKNIIETISREGRKFMTSLVLVSQRPVNLSTTALSQCNTQLILRILNPYDLDYVGRTSEGITRSTLSQITSLGVGECLVAGSAINYPTFIKIRTRLVKDKLDELTFEAIMREYDKKNLVNTK